MPTFNQDLEDATQLQAQLPEGLEEDAVPVLADGSGNQLSISNISFNEPTSPMNNSSEAGTVINKSRAEE